MRPTQAHLIRGLGAMGTAAWFGILSVLMAPVVGNLSFVAAAFAGVFLFAAIAELGRAAEGNEREADGG